MNGDLSMVGEAQDALGARVPKVQASGHVNVVRVRAVQRCIGSAVNVFWLHARRNLLQQLPRHLFSPPHRLVHPSNPETNVGIRMYAITFTTDGAGPTSVHGRMAIRIPSHASVARLPS